MLSPMPPRHDLIRAQLHKAQLDVLVCALPANVVMLSGYWPVVGAGASVAFADGRVGLVVPEDESELTQSGWADEIRTFRPSSLDRLGSAADAIREPLSQLVGSSPRRIGFEGRETSEPAPYSAMHLYLGSMADLLRHCFPEADLVPADQILAELRARKSQVEIDRLRNACQIAGRAFAHGAASVRAGASEFEVADAFRDLLNEGWGAHRAGGFVWCMSGANSALASGAYARSRSTRLSRGDLVLVHCNSYSDGYWTDITRTYCIGGPDERQRAIFDAVLRAREAALNVIRPGTAAADVDRAAREVLRERGFGDAFKHSAGHGVGFGAIDPSARPRLHPKSPDLLEPGMVFNLEPAAYFDGYGGVRHCDTVAVTDSGCELLTPFQFEAADLHTRIQ